MPSSRSIRALLFALLAVLPAFAQSAVQLVDPGKLPAAQKQARKPAPAQPVLPASFAGWQRQTVQAGRDPAKVDPGNAAVFKEYGITDFERAGYASGGRTVEVQAARFADAGGAWGMFTFLRQPTDKAETVGDQAAASANGILFYRGNILVRVDLGRLTAAPIADLRELAAALPPAVGSARNLPSLPNYLPKQPLASVRYLAGPVGAAMVRLPLTPAEVRWDDGAEAVWAQRQAPAGAAEVVLISYPTPQLAAARLRDVEASIARTPPNGIAQVARRSGPIVVWVGGPIPIAEAHALAVAVNYNAQITWNEPTYLGKKDNVGNLVVAALALSGIILLMSLIAGIAFGGVRILMKRLYPDRVFDRYVEVIRLHLSD